MEVRYLALEILDKLVDFITFISYYFKIIVAEHDCSYSSSLVAGTHRRVINSTT